MMQSERKMTVYYCYYYLCRSFLTQFIPRDFLSLSQSVHLVYYTNIISIVLTISTTWIPSFFLCLFNYLKHNHHVQCCVYVCIPEKNRVNDDGSPRDDLCPQKFFFCFCLKHKRKLLLLNHRPCVLVTSCCLCMRVWAWNILLPILTLLLITLLPSLMKKK